MFGRVFPMGKTGKKEGFKIEKGFPKPIWEGKIINQGTHQGQPQ